MIGASFPIYQLLVIATVRLGSLSWSLNVRDIDGRLAKQTRNKHSQQVLEICYSETITLIGSSLNELVFSKYYSYEWRPEIRPFSKDVTPFGIDQFYFDTILLHPDQNNEDMTVSSQRAICLGSRAVTMVEGEGSFEGLCMKFSTNPQDCYVASSLLKCKNQRRSLVGVPIGPSPSVIIFPSWLLRRETLPFSPPTDSVYIDFTRSITKQFDYYRMSSKKWHT